MKIWKASPATIFVVDRDDRIIWSSGTPLGPGSHRDCTRLADAFKDRLSEDDIRQLTEAVCRSRSTQKAATFWIGGANLPVSHNRQFVHCTQLPQCASADCKKITVISVLAARQIGSKPENHVPQANLEDRLLALRESAEQLGQTLDRKPLDEKPKTLVELPHLVRQSFRQSLGSDEQLPPKFVMNTDPDTPRITTVESDWEELLKLLMVHSRAADKDQADSEGAEINITISRSARSVEFLFERKFGQSQCEFERYSLVRAARKVGQVIELDVGIDAIRLKIRTSVNAGIIAPEPSDTEHRIRRLCVAANANRVENPIPRSRKSG